MKTAQEIIENNIKFKDDPRVQWCMNNLILINSIPIEYNITDDNKLIIYGNVVIPYTIDKLPIKIDEVYGDVLTSNNTQVHQNYRGQLISLENMPTIIHGIFNIANNPKLTALLNGPTHVDKNYRANNCGLTDLTGIAEYIGGYLMLYSNQLKSIYQLSNIIIEKEIDLDFNPCVNNNILYEQLDNMHKISH